MRLGVEDDLVEVVPIVVISEEQPQILECLGQEVTGRMRSCKHVKNSKSKYQARTWAWNSALGALLCQHPKRWRSRTPS